MSGCRSGQVAGPGHADPAFRAPAARSLRLIGAWVPGDHSAQTLADAYIAPELARLGRDGSAPPRVVDLGCGAGDSVDAFRAARPDVAWVGVDLERSPEVDARTRADAEFRSFDGERLPFGDGSVDLVFCKQVLEHVRRPAPLLAEVARVLRPGGGLAGSTSQLEPFHSLSTFGYTPYGLTLLLADAGLEPVELRPGIDGAALLVRHLLGMPGWTRRWWSGESPLNRALEAYGRVRRLDARQRNAMKLVVAGQFAFLARRPA